ncbi:hypothetical protein EJ03DRAFT_350857 [Teratosphaeria nubilosa]|uniref:Uncharacterized protein n=1 Tax=Teratosphaeria nubilosa TaxID=161662 RepID=A0A6G1LAA5_9PEZI|nr:hypothetical protein EJ03DRAFT_350857 [Teratosphaeria nubilosa]
MAQQQARYNVAITKLKRSSHVGIGQPIEVSMLEQTDWSYGTIELAWDRARQALCETVQGRAALDRLAALFTGNASSARAWQQLLVRKIREKSPILVVDETMTESQVVAEHPRGTWEGSPADFNIRDQAIKFNSYRVDRAKELTQVLHYRHRQYQARQITYEQYGKADKDHCLGQFRIIHAACHETGGHLLVTDESRTRHHPGEDDI